MPVRTRKRTTRIITIVAAASITLLLAGAASLISVLIGQSCSGGAFGADAPSQVAQRDIPASFLSIYEQADSRYKIPWEILAGVGKEECDRGRNPDPSCTPDPSATGPGVANCAGASGFGDADPRQSSTGSGSVRRRIPRADRDPPSAGGARAAVAEGHLSSASGRGLGSLRVGIVNYKMPRLHARGQVVENCQEWRGVFTA